MAHAPTRNATKKKAAAPLTEQAKMILRTVRRQLAVEQQAQAERLRQETINKVRSVNTPHDTRYLKRTVVDPAELAFQKIVVPRTTAVLTSEGIRATVNVKMNDPAGTRAWTDYQNINVTLERGIEQEPRKATAVLRGLLYHEGGHIKRTVPLNVLINRYNAAIKGTNIPPLSSTDMGTYHKAWNLAEDQRMEMQVVDDSPAKALYFVPMVLDVCLKIYNDPDAAKADCYPFVAWRRYMPKALRRDLRAKFITKYGIDKCRAMEKALTSYIRATTPFDMVMAVMEFHDSLQDLHTQSLLDMIDNHEFMLRGNGFDRDQPEQPPIVLPMDIDEDLSDDEEDGGDGDAYSGGTSAGQGKGVDDQSWVPSSDLDYGIDDDTATKADKEEDEAEEEDDHQNNEDVERDDTTVDDDDDLSTDDIERMLNEAEEERNDDPVLNQFEREFNMSLSFDVPGSKLRPLHSSGETNSLINATAHTLAEQLEEAFHAVTVEASPVWREQQTRGVLNVARYLTKQHGDREFFRDFDGMEGEKPGYNMAVSVLLDYSGSMGGSEGELAATAFAMKAACDNLDIPCTVVLWDNDARLLWDGEDRAEVVPVFSATGGTDPGTALADLVNQRYDRETHIVLLMTDGEFYTQDGYLNGFRSEGTYFIGAYYKHGSVAHNTELASMSAKGFDIVHGVQELGQLVDLMESALCESVKVP